VPRAKTLRVLVASASLLFALGKIEVIICFVFSCSRAVGGARKRLTNWNVESHQNRPGWMPQHCSQSLIKLSQKGEIDLGMDDA
jgi:hypothetical protein